MEGSVARVARQLRELIIELVYPPRCGGCGLAGVYFCSGCLARLAPLLGPRCPRCDDDKGSPVARSGGCARCFRQFPSLDGLRLLGAYENPLKEAVHALKYNGFTAVAQPLGQQLAAQWRARGVPVDGAIPVPLHEERLRQRGYNQSTLLAAEFCKAVGVPLLEGLITRVRPTRPQVGLGHAERLQNVRGAFVASTAAAGGRWLLIDDVCTSGSTLEACAAALRARGAQQVWALVLARPSS